MQRKRVSSGLNWKPHFMFCEGLDESEREVVEEVCVGASVYAISVGTLSDVIPRGSLYESWEVDQGPMRRHHTISTGPRLNNVDIVGGRAVYRCNA